MSEENKGQRPQRALDIYPLTTATEGVITSTLWKQLLKGSYYRPFGNSHLKGYNIDPLEIATQGVITLTLWKQLPKLTPGLP